MRNISNEFAALLAANHTLLMKATLTLADSTVVNLGSEDFMAGSARFEQAVSSDGSFDVGGTIVGTMTVTLANHTGKFDAYDFEGATIVPYVGKHLPNDTYEWLRLGVYDVVKPDSYGGTIGITCSDKLGRLARHALSELNVTYPTYPQALLSAVASHCGLAVTYRLSPAVNTASVIRPPDSDMSLLDAAGYLAQMMGYWLRCDNMGNIVASWYDFFESDLDGGTFTSDEDSLDGGSLTDYTGELVAGGAFTSSGNEPILIGDAFSTTVKTEDITVTGIQVTESDEVSSSDNNETNGATGRTFIRGTKEYCLAMSQNPFIGYGHGEEVAVGLYTRVGGMRFRPYNDSIPCDPTIEAGDAVVVTDRKGNTYNAYVTGVILKPDGAMETRCSAKAPASNSNVSASPVSMVFTALKATAERSNQVAAAALEIASAIGQFAWNDNAGTHVSTEEAVAEGTRNILLNSYGILLRAAANYLAALTQSGIAFYDGTGNLADNIVASFGSSGAQIGNIDETLGHSADQYKMLLDSSGLHIVFQGTQDVVVYDTPTEVTSLGVGVLDLLGLHLESYHGGSSSNYSTIKSDNKELYISTGSGYADRGIYIGDFDPAAAKHPVTIYDNTGVNGDIYLPNNKSIYGTDTNGNAVYALETCNANNNLTLGYGGYAASQGNTNIYGNNIALQAKNHISFNAQTAYPNGTALPSAGNSTDFYAIGINAFSNGGIVKYKGLADVKTWLGMGNVDYTNTNWVTGASGCYYRKRAGYVCLVFANRTWDGTSETTIYTLPSGYRPNYKLNVASANSGANGQQTIIVIQTDGAVRFVRNASNASKYFNACITYPVG